MVQRDRQDEAIDVIRRLFKGERVTKKTDWYTLQDAALQLLPLQEDMPFAVASQISPSGMTLAGKYGIGIISLGSMSERGPAVAADAMGLRREPPPRSTARRSTARTGACCSAGTSPRRARRRARRPSTA